MHIRFVLDYQAWERAEPSTDRDKTTHSSAPPHLGLEDAYDWAHWDIPIRHMIQTLSKRFPDVAGASATMPMLIEDFWLVGHVWIPTDYLSAGQHLQRYLDLISLLGGADEATAWNFAKHLDPDDAAWVLFTLRETRYWLVHMLQSVTTRFLPPEYLLRNTGQEN